MLLTAGTGWLEGVSYDQHGNLLSLKQRNEAGNLADNFTYAYQMGTNRLLSMSDYKQYRTQKQILEFSR